MVACVRRAAGTIFDDMPASGILLLKITLVYVRLPGATDRGRCERRSVTKILDLCYLAFTPVFSVVVMDG